MLYLTLRWTAAVALRWLYRDVHVDGRERVPRRGPLLIAANHPNQLIDVLLVATALERRVLFTGKAVLLHNPLVAALFRAVGFVPLRRASDDADLARRIGAIFAVSRGTYGSPRVHAELRAQGVRVGRNRVARLMREAGLGIVTRRRAPRTTDSRHGLPVAPNLLGRRFAAERPDAVWLADISYLPTGEGWLYLAAIKDLATREIVGWSMADHLGADLACDALLMAIRRRRPPRGLLHHSDRGSQGGFTWSSQRLGGGRSRWRVGGVRIGRCAPS